MDIIIKCELNDLIDKDHDHTVRYKLLLDLLKSHRTHTFVLLLAQQFVVPILFS